MSFLQQIKRGGETLPPRFVLSGPEGIGKSTFAAGAPYPLFISQEDGLMGLDHVERFYPPSFGDIMLLIDELIASEHPYLTLVIDTIDWIERSIQRYICDRDNKKSIEDYGYGKGYNIVIEELVLLLAKLDHLRNVKKMGIIALSHVHIKKFTDPAGVEWDRYEMKGHKGFTGIFREWPDACLFATYEVFKAKERGSNKEKAVGGERVIRTQWSPGWDAKNRMGLPETIPLNYQDFAAAVEENRPELVRTRFADLLKTSTLEGKEREKWEKINIETLAPDRLRAGIEKLQLVQPK